MALDNAALLEVLEAMQAAGVEDRVRTAAQTIYQALIDAELTAVIGAGPWERTDQRTTQRNGSRPRAMSREDTASAEVAAHCLLPSVLLAIFGPSPRCVAGSMSRLRPSALRQGRSRQPVLNESDDCFGSAPARVLEDPQPAVAIASQDDCAAVAHEHLDAPEVVAPLIEVATDLDQLGALDLEGPEPA